MNGQILTRINEPGKAIKESKKVSKEGLLIGIWKGLKVSDKELEEAKKAPFNFDVEKYIR